MQILDTARYFQHCRFYYLFGISEHNSVNKIAVAAYIPELLNRYRLCVLSKHRLNTANGVALVAFILPASGALTKRTLNKCGKDQRLWNTISVLIHKIKPSSRF